MIWTDSQQKAINSRNGTVLVSAAAGSGKTAVLVQRVIELLTDEKKPVMAEKLLVVTFTKAAAAEMKERIARSLGELIEKDPANSFLKRQKMFIPSASICTMDSFCSKLVRESFEALELNPDFTAMSDDEYRLMLNETAQEVLSDIYANGGEGEKALLELFTNGRSDSNLLNSLISVYNFSVADPDPKSWLDNRFSEFSTSNPPEKTLWGRYAYGVLLSRTELLAEKIEKILLDSEDEPGKLQGAVNIDLLPILKQVKELISLVKAEGEWDKVKELTDSFKLENFTRFKKDEKSELYFEIKERRDSIKDDFKRLGELLVCTSEEFYSDIEYLRPIALAFSNAVKSLGERLAQKEKEKNSYYFSDILHLALRLLISRENGEIKPTDTARELSEQYDCILIDEFQDTNEAQNALFNAVSKNGGNIFMVGDVKQSIYRFRQAMPEIFLRYKNSFPEYEKDNYPAKINLDCNFRSRKGVVDAINFFFDFLMTEKLGDIDYKAEDRLVFGADYAETDNCDVQVHIVKAPDARASNVENEARYVGRLILDAVSGKMTVGARGKERPLQYGDICILLRSAKNKAKVFADVLSVMGIPVSYEKKGGFFDCSEVITIVSLLKVIDNPVQDVPLVAVMLSPMFAFTEDDLALMRCGDKSANIYTLLKQNSENSKASELLETVKRLRSLSVTLGVGELIRRALEMTAYDSIAGALEGGEKRRLNLSLLVSYAEAYEKNGGKGLSGFIRYIDRLRENRFDLNSVAGQGGADTVKIMTVHKSKGLEFPLVILADCSSDFVRDNSSKAVVDKTMGFGALRYSKELHSDFMTQPYKSVLLKNQYEELSESMRVLYVAMTRAREKLWLVGSLYNPANALYKLYCSKYTDSENRGEALASCSDLFKWILLSLMSHPNSFSGTDIQLPIKYTAETEAKIQVFVADPPEKEGLQQEDTVKPDFDNALVEKIREKADFIYPYSYLSGLPVKYTASNMNPQLEISYLTADNPAFLGENSMTPALRGTLMHRFMEKCDFSLAEKSCEKELERLTDLGVFTAEQSKAVNLKKAEEFFKSPLYSRIKSAQGFWREKEFTMEIGLDKVSGVAEAAGESAVVQGVIDGIIVNGSEGEILDYKTDRANDEKELSEKYRLQMLMYKLAAEECFGLKNVKVTLYSFSLQKEISINF